jgi:hypothetical protein
MVRQSAQCRRNLKIDSADGGSSSSQFAAMWTERRFEIGLARVEFLKDREECGSVSV